MIEKERMEYYESHDDNDYMLLGDLNLKGKAKIIIVELCLKEGWKKSYFHLYNDSFDCAIKLNANEYFIHGEYKDKLNDDQAKLFDEYLREMPKYVDISRWTLAKYDFNRKFQNHTIKIKEQPNYTMINYT